MPANPDPYLLPNDTLKNKRGLTSKKELQDAEDQATAGRATLLMAALPKPPFTFDTLKQIHRELFQDVYEWAGQPRTGPLSKREFDDPKSPVQTFTAAAEIEARASVLFDKLAKQGFLAGTSRASFAAGATDAFIELNAIHFAREGNGRSQRMLLTAMAANAGHALNFDIITRERMVAVSIAAHKGDPSGIRRMFDEVLDPRQVEAMRKAIGFLAASKTVAWNDRYISTTRPGQDYTGVLVGRAGQDFMFRAQEQGTTRVLIGDVRDQPAGSVSGDRIEFRAAHFAPAAEPSSRPRTAVGSIAAAMQAPDATVRPPWEAAPVPMAARVRAMEAEAAKQAATKPQATQDAEPEPPKPKPGPRP